MSPNGLGKPLQASGIHIPATCSTAGFKQPLFRFFALLFSTLFLLLSPTPASAVAPDHVSTTLEGCRNDGSITLPNIDGKFICPDAVYTSGNLGKGWNELDLVPYRATLQAGNSAPATQTYTIAVVVDNKDGGKPGYDVLSTLTKNTALSSPSCPDPIVGSETLAIPGLGGISESRYRLVTITNQAKNTSCVYDYFARLALGSHLFPGSSLHANMALPVAGSITTSGIGARDISIPVKEISPQELSKTMAATQDTDYTWNVTKEAKPIEVSFGNVCAKDFNDNLPVEITIEWTRSAAINGKITVTTNIKAKNPASRTITVDVFDKIYKGLTQTTQVGTTASKIGVDVAAKSEITVLTNTQILDASDGSEGAFNDVATATYTDKVTGIEVPGNTTAKANATISTGTSTNATAVITDTESISGDFLEFSVGSPSLGSFDPAYVPGTKTTGPVNWTSGEQSGSGSVVFNKTIYLNGQKITSGTLTDTATLTPKDSSAQSTGPVSVAIVSSSAAELKIDKTISQQAMSFLAIGEKYVIRFTIKGDNGYESTEELTFNPSNAEAKQSATVSNLLPGTYTVTEESLFFTSDPNDQGSTGVITNGLQRVVPLTVNEGTPICEGTATFVNTVALSPATAEVQKVTDPVVTSGDDYIWTFTLKGGVLPPAGVTAQANAGDVAVSFGVDLEEGSYTVEETLKSGWDLNSVNNNTALNKCEFTVDYPADASKVFSCLFKNTKRAEVQVIKTFKGSPITGSEVFTFSLRTGASAAANGTILQTLQANAGNGGTITFDKVVPGSYQLCEQGIPVGWTTSLSSMLGAFSPPNGGDNSTTCVSFIASAGQTVKFTIDNAPPPEGQARTIGYWKNWASCKQSGGKQAPVLDRTMALAEPTGILDDLLLNSSTGLSGLHGSVATPDVAPDCSKAVSLLNKSTFSGTKKASDPLFNMAAQLVAAELNYVAGAKTCAKVSKAIEDANKLLTNYQFTGDGYTGKLSPADASLARSLATRLDNYNNNLPSACL